MQHLSELYEALHAAGVTIDHHEGDLYVPATARDIIEASGWTFEPFRCAITGEPWLDVAFGYHLETAEDACLDHAGRTTPQKPEASQ